MGRSELDQSKREENIGRSYRTYSVMERIWRHPFIKTTLWQGLVLIDPGSEARTCVGSSYL